MFFWINLHIGIIDIISVFVLHDCIWVAVSSTTSVHLSVRSFWMIRLKLVYIVWSIWCMHSIHPLVNHSADSPVALASMSSMHLHLLHSHWVLWSVRYRSVIEIWSVSATILVLMSLLINGLNSTSRLWSSHKLLLIERAVKILNQGAGLLHSVLVINNGLLTILLLILKIAVSWPIASSADARLASSSGLTPIHAPILPGLAMAGLWLAILNLLVQHMASDVITHAILMIGISWVLWDHWRLRCVGILDVLLLPLILWILPIIIKRFQTETLTHDSLLFIIHLVDRIFVLLLAHIRYLVVDHIILVIYIAVALI